MEDKKCEKQTPIQFGCKQIIPGVSSNESGSADIQIVNADQKEDHVRIFASPTPEKPESSSKSDVITSFVRKNLVGSFQDEHVVGQSAGHEKTHMISVEDLSVSIFSGQSSRVLGTPLKDKAVELPEKYKALVDLFNRMESSIRLLHLWKKLPTFQNIQTQVEVLTKRKFLCSHLAQMKYVFSEAIQIEKILIHDEKSLCMNPYMKISLLLDVVECTHPEQSMSMALCQAFHERLLDFFNNHTEGTDIPEAMLPEPFNPTSPTLFLKRLPDELSSELPRTTFVDLESLSSASHFPSSFQRQFSQKVIMPETQRSQLLPATTLMESIISDDKVKRNRESPQKQDRSSSVLTHKASVEVISTPNCYMASHHSESTPAKGNSSLDDVMTETPAQQTPKRPMPTPHDKMVIENANTTAEFRLTSSARRSLIYSSSETEGSMTAPVVPMVEKNKTIQYSSHQAGSEISGSLVNPCVGTDIPEAMLPEPFNPTNPSLFLKRLPDELSSELPRTTFVDLESLSSASHFPSSFQRQFSQKVIMPETQRSQLLPATALMESIINDDKVKRNRESPQKQDRFSSVLTHKASVEVISTPNRYMASHHSESTPAKGNSSLDDVMTETPAQQTPKRPMPTPHDKMVIENANTAAEFRLTSSARRSLIYSSSETEGSMTAPVVPMAEKNKTIQYSSHQAGSEISGSLINPCVVHEVVLGTIEDHEVDQMGRRKHQEMLACLLDIFDTICIISRSTDCSLITKQELVHKILSNNLEIEETREVEEQLELLEELVPDWICKKVVSSGDLLYCIKQTSDPKSVRASLIEAV